MNTPKHLAVVGDLVLTVCLVFEHNPRPESLNL